MKKIAPVVVLVAVALVGSAVTLFVNSAANSAAQSQFDIIANEATNRLERRVSQHLLLLNATAAHLETSNTPLERRTFASYIDALNLTVNYAGVRGIGFALLTDQGADRETAEIIKSNYGIDRPAWPLSNEAYRTPIILLEPQDIRNKAAIGYDMFSEKSRRIAMEKSIASGEAAASAPVDLIQEITDERQKGFLVYVPVKLPPAMNPFDSDKSEISGFVYSPFRLGDLHESALGVDELPIYYRTVDRDAGGTVLAQSPDYENRSLRSRFRADRMINIAGREWTVQFSSSPAFVGDNWQIGTILLGVVSLLFAAALATSARAQLQSLEAANRLAALSRQAVEDKDMMLQEMKHRIKNSIARVLAIARQTAHSSADIQEYTTSFFARLQSMATAQELLTRSHWENADLRELLTGELDQVLGDSWDNKRLSGEKVSLNARATQALGLTFHELATNALKYGDPKGIARGLAVTWTFTNSNGTNALKIEWVEPGCAIQQVSKGGFGSKLISMNVERELDGTLERVFDASGLTIKMSFPTKAVL